MNRRTLLTTLLSGLSVGVDAIAGKKKIGKVEEVIHAEGVDLTVINSGCPIMLGHTRDLSIGRITEISETRDGIGFTYEYEPDGYMHRWRYSGFATDPAARLEIKGNRS